MLQGMFAKFRSLSLGTRLLLSYSPRATFLARLGTARAAGTAGLAETVVAA
jgi:hypothetical protein